MKKFIIIFISLFIITFPLKIWAQPNPIEVYIPSEKKYKNVISYNPNAMFINGLTLGYERLLKEKFSVRILSRYSFAENSNFFGLKETKETKIELQPRFYLGDSSKSLYGFYAMPFIRYKNLKGIKDVDVVGTKEINAEAFSLGVAMGFQFISKAQLSADFYLGGNFRGSFKDYEAVGKNQVFRPYTRGANFTMGINIGVGF